MELDLVLKLLVMAGMCITTIVGFVVLFKLKELHLTLNSRLDQLIKASVSQGRQDERDSQKPIARMEGILKEKGLL